MVIEIALFRVKEGIPDEQVLAVSNSLQQSVLAFPGYLGRRLSKSEDGQWADIVQWRSMEEAMHAMQAIEGQECLKAFLEIEQPGTSQILHLHPVKEYEGGRR